MNSSQNLQNKCFCIVENTAKGRGRRPRNWRFLATTCLKPALAFFRRAQTCFSFSSNTIRKEMSLRWLTVTVEPRVSYVPSLTGGWVATGTGPPWGLIPSVKSWKGRVTAEGKRTLVSPWRRPSKSASWLPDTLLPSPVLARLHLGSLRICLHLSQTELGCSNSWK